VQPLPSIDAIETAAWLPRLGQHADTILLSAELEFAAWSTSGQKLWTMFVEPPWHYTIDGDTVELDVMGNPISTNPTLSRQKTRRPLRVSATFPMRRRDLRHVPLSETLYAALDCSVRSEMRAA
jgi:hypothetical protein